MTSSRSSIVDPTLTGSADDGIFGIPGTLTTSALVYIPVPWEVTTSYGNGTSKGPAAILQASPQLDFYVRGLPNHFEKGFYLLAVDPEIVELNTKFKPEAEAIQEVLETHGSLAEKPEMQVRLAAVNRASATVNERVYQQSKILDDKGKFVAVIGGDHSSPLGLINFLCEKYSGEFGVLHIDAHHDLRDSYQGFEYSHASIMRNVLKHRTAPKSLVQVGIRDFSADEAAFAVADPAINTFYDEDIKERLFCGETYSAVVDDIVRLLPDRVYVSFDIDGLQPDLCPSTGTPVAGGLSFEQAQFLIKSLVKAGKQIIGFDLCEVAPNPRAADDEWDGNVGARVLFLLSSWVMESQSV